MEFLLILIVLVIIFGLGVVVVGRRGRGGGGAGGGGVAVPPRPAPPRPEPQAEVEATGPPGGLELPEVELTDEEIEALLEDEELQELLIEQELAEEPGLVEEAEGAVVAPEELVRPRFRDRLGKARAAIAGILGGVRGRRKIDEDTWQDLEDALITADVGVGLSTDLVELCRARVKTDGVTDPGEVLELLKQEILSRLGDADRSLLFEPGQPNVWLFVGVNGVGKTTTIGKVGAQQRAEGRSVVMAAGDTFRAAAAEQLETWAQRAGADFVRGNEGGDPGAVIFDAVQRAAARGYDLVLGDTAGRLHTKVNLMEELRKVRRVAEREPGKVTEVLLVVDATTGQNGLAQAKQFTEAVDVTGVVLTKLDGSAKGGIVLAIQEQLGIPVKLVGLGETIGDLVAFDPAEFVDALFSE